MQGVHRTTSPPNWKNFNINHVVEEEKNYTVGVCSAGSCADGTPGSDLRHLSSPSYVIVVDDIQYIADHGNSRILRWKLGDLEADLVASGSSLALEQAGHLIIPSKW